MTFHGRHIAPISLESGILIDRFLKLGDFFLEAGDFPVELTVERLYPVITSLQVPSGMSMRALLEVRRGAQLSAAGRGTKSRTGDRHGPATASRSRRAGPQRQVNFG